MPADGSCLLHSLKLGDAAELRKQIVTWLKVNPHHPLPFQASTLSEHTLIETGEAWPEYCDRLQHTDVWTGIPELVAAAHIYRTCIRVFSNVGPGRFHLRAVFGETPILLDVNSPPIDIVYGSDHYDSLIDARLMKLCEHGAVWPTYCDHAQR